MLVVERRYHLLVFEDSVGITSGYKGIWHDLLDKCGLQDTVVKTMVRSSYLTFKKKQHLEWKKNRKQPGFNTNPQMQQQVRSWVQHCIEQHKPDMIVCFDPALLFILNPVWQQATLDTLRGGFYVAMGLPWIVTLPLTAHHAKMKPKDIAKLNQGFVEKGDFEDYRAELEESEDEDEDEISNADDEEDSSRMEWHEPVIIPYGRIVLEFDYRKVARILGRIKK